VKLLARDDDLRPQDRADLQALVAEATDGDIQLAMEAVGLIEVRGYARGRNLRADLDTLLSSTSGRSNPG